MPVAFGLYANSGIVREFERLSLPRWQDRTIIQKKGKKIQVKNFRTLGLIASYVSRNKRVNLHGCAHLVYHRVHSLSGLWLPCATTDEMRPLLAPFKTIDTITWTKSFAHTVWRREHHRSALVHRCTCRVAAFESHLGRALIIQALSALLPALSSIPLQIVLDLQQSRVLPNTIGEQRTEMKNKAMLILGPRVKSWVNNTREPTDWQLYHRECMQMPLAWWKNKALPTFF